MKTDYFITLSKIYILATTLALCSCAPTTKDLCGVFLNIGEYENYGNLDFIIVNPDYTYEHIFVQQGETTLNKSTWETGPRLGEDWIVFKDWIDYGYSATIWSSHKPWSFSTTYIHRHKKYVNIPKDNIFDDDYDYYKLSDKEIKKYKIECY